MKKKAAKSLLPRRRWRINPVTRVEDTARVYSRRQARREERKLQNDEE